MQFPSQFMYGRTQLALSGAEGFIQPGKARQRAARIDVSHQC